MTQPRHRGVSSCHELSALDLSAQRLLNTDGRLGTRVLTRYPIHVAHFLTVFPAQLTDTALTNGLAAAGAIRVRPQMLFQV
jgi:hypothetical protein